MIVGICTCEILIYDSNSLKEKRGIIKSIIDKTKNKFNISISEVAENDKWQKAVIGFSVVSNDTKIVDSTMEKVIRFMSSYSEIEIINIEKEIL